MTDSFITRDSRRLRRGYTTGSCAAAAAKASALMLLTGRELRSVTLTTPSGVELDLPLRDAVLTPDHASCAVVKDSGDDPDVTNGIAIYARVERTDGPGVEILGGEGIGAVTKPGLDQPVGAAAINSVPRRMIDAALREVCEDCGCPGGLRVTISAPDGAEIAKRTFNPRLGILGGISILGTTGTVEPMSDRAVVETVRAELSLRRAGGRETALLVPGNIGAEFAKTALGLDPTEAVTVSNFVGEALALADELGFRGALLVSHIGKAVKLAGGLFNTHSRYGDCRAEIFASHAALCGAGKGTVRRIMSAASADAMVEALDAASLRAPVLRSIHGRIDAELSARYPRLVCGVLTFSSRYGVLGKTGRVEELRQQLRNSA